MDLAERDEERLLRATMRDLFARHASIERVRWAREKSDGFDPELWSLLVGAGVPGLLVTPPDGLGLGVAAAVTVAEQVGRVLAPAPAASAMLAGWLIDSFGGDLRDRLLADSIDGSARFAICCPHGSASLAYSGTQLVLSGGAAVVRDVVGATALLCILEIDGAARVAVIDLSAPTVMITPNQAAGHLREGEVQFNQHVVAPDQLLGRSLGRSDVARLQALQVTIEGAEITGACERALEYASEHVKSRHQFGRALGSFQAVQHRLVDALLDLDRVRWLTRRTAVALDTGAENPLLLAGCLAVLISAAPRRILAAAHQVHGGVGFVREHPLHMYFGRERAAALTVGPLRRSRERLAELVFDTEMELP